MSFCHMQEDTFLLSPFGKYAPEQQTCKLHLFLMILAKIPKLSLFKRKSNSDGLNTMAYSVQNPQLNYL